MSIACRRRVVFPGAQRQPLAAGPSPMLSHDSAVPLYHPAQSPAQSPVRHRLSSLPSTTHKQKKVPISVMYITSITHIKYWTTLHVASLVTQSPTVSPHGISPPIHSFTALVAGCSAPTYRLHGPRCACMPRGRVSGQSVCASPMLAAAGLTPHDRIRCVAR
jgi:hypothetical protein